MGSLKTHTVILGAGISGLSVAHFLSKKNNDFLVVEKTNRVGGYIHSQKKNGFLIENGPNTVLINNPSIQQLIDDCHLTHSLIFSNDDAKNNRYLLRDGKLQLLPKTPKEFLWSPIMNWHQKLTLLKDLFASKHKQDTTVASFISKRFGKAAAKQLFEPFLTGIYAGNIEEMSTKHTLNKIWSLEQQYGSVIKGLKKQKSKNSPRIFNFPDGLSQLTDTLGKKYKANLLLNQDMKQISSTDDGYKLTTTDNSIQCQRIISTIPSFALSTLIENHHLASSLNTIRYVPVDVFHFGFEKASVKNQSPGFGVLSKPSDNKHFLGILFNSRIFPHVCSLDKELFTVIVGGDLQSHLCQLPSQELKSLILKEVNELLECSADPIFTNHTVYKKGIPQYHLNHDKIEKEIKEFETNNSNFYILGNYFNGVSVSDCIKNADSLVHKLYS